DRALARGGAANGPEPRALHGGAVEVESVHVVRRICGTAAKVRMIEHVQELALEREAEVLSNRNRFRDRQIIIDEVRPPEVGNRAEIAGGGIGSEIAGIRAPADGVREVLGVDDLNERWGALLRGGAIGRLILLQRHAVFAHGVLQLRNADAIEIHAAIAEVVDGEITALHLERRAGLEGEDGSERPPTNDAAEHAGLVEIAFAGAERQVIGAAGVHRVADIVGDGRIAHTQIAQAELVELTGPLAGRRPDAQGVAPGVVHVELHTVPLLLAEIHLQAVVGGIAAGHHVAGVLAGGERVGLEDVDRIRAARAGVVGGAAGRAGREGVRYEVAEVRHRSLDAGKGAGKGAGLALVEPLNELAIAVVGQGAAGAGGCFSGEGGVEDCPRIFAREAQVGEGLSGVPSGAVVAIGGIDGEIGLGVSELREEAALVDVGLVGVEADPLVHAAAADVADLDGVAAAERALNAQVPRLDVGLLDVRINTRGGDRRILFERVEERHRRFRIILRIGIEGSVTVGGLAWRRRKRNAARGERAGRASVVRIEIEALVEERAVIGAGVPKILIWLGVVAQGEAGADDGVAAAGQPAQKALRELRIPGDADLQLRALVPGGVLMAAGDVLRIGIAEQNAGTELIADARGTENPRGRKAVIGAGEVVVIADEVEANAVIQRESGLHAEGIASEQAPGLREFVEIVGAGGLIVSADLRVIRILAGNLADAAREDCV